MIGEDEAERINGLGRLLGRSDNDWPTVLHNISKSRQVWGHLGKLLLREEPEPTVSETFYHAVVQAVILFGAET